MGTTRHEARRRARRGRLAALAVAGLAVLGACGSGDEGTRATGAGDTSSETTFAPLAAEGQGRPLTPGAAAGVAALDCTSGAASSLSHTEVPPAPGDTRTAATVVAEALRAKQVVPEAAAAVEAQGPALEESWAAGPAGVDVADAGGALDVTATVDAAAPETPATVTITRDGRTIVTVSLSEVQPGYWALDQLWACAEEIAVTEVPG